VDAPRALALNFHWCTSLGVIDGKTYPLFTIAFKTLYVARIQRCSGSTGINARTHNNVEAIEKYVFALTDHLLIFQQGTFSSVRRAGVYGSFRAVLGFFCGRGRNCCEPFLFFKTFAEQLNSLFMLRQLL